MNAANPPAEATNSGEAAPADVEPSSSQQEPVKGSSGRAPENKALESFVRLAFAADDRLTEAQRLRFYQFACTTVATQPLGADLLQLSLSSAGVISSKSRDFANRVALAVELLTVTAT